jgi:hypothetical protein
MDVNNEKIITIKTEITMKTQKTNNNSIRTILVATAVMIGGLTVSAQKSLATFNLYELFNNAEIENASTIATAASTATMELDPYTGSLDFVIEEYIELENWMTSNADWSINMSLLNETAVEEEIQVEDWMTNFKIPQPGEQESEIQLEAWMYTMDSWK